MSHIVGRFTNTKLTVWRSVRDEYNGESWSRVGEILVTSDKTSAVAVSNTGEQFSPKASYVASGTPDIQYNDIVAEGSYTESDPNDLGFVDRAMSVQTFNNNGFGWSPSVRIMVG